MQRSRSQVLYSYLPGAIFQHDDEFIGRVVSVDGKSAASDVNARVLFERLEEAIKQWNPEDRRISLPSQVGEDQFELITPETVNWEIWPLVFQCSNRNCLVVRRFQTQKQAVEYVNDGERLKCERCGGKIIQLRYFTAHNCGRIEPLFTPECSNCSQRDEVYFDDTGVFSSSVWRCRRCNGRYIQGQRFTPCNCGKYIKRNQKVPYQRAMTVKDSQAYYVHCVSIINLKGSGYEELLRHPNRGEAAISSLLGDETRLSRLLDQLDRESDGDRMSAEEWANREAQLRAMGFPEEDIAVLKRERGPAASGLALTRSGLTPEFVAVGESQGMLERAALWSEVADRRTLEEAIENADNQAESEALAQAKHTLLEAGIEQVSVTLRFPIAMAAYGYTRGSSAPQTSTIHDFDIRGAGGRPSTTKTPIFVAAVDTEALIVELSASRILDWAKSRSLLDPNEPIPEDERAAKLRLLQEFAQGSDASIEITTLVHSMAHILLRALDDGRSGFGEASLAEWVVPEALTFAIYVASYKEAPLGALWTLMHTRAEAWVEQSLQRVFRCDNDPLCHHRKPMACERCMFLTFGCDRFNGDLARDKVMDFVRYLEGS